MQKAILMELRRENGKFLRHLPPLLLIELHDVCHGIAIGRLQRDEIADRIKQPLGVSDESHGLRTLKSPLFQEQRLDVSPPGPRCPDAKARGNPDGERCLAITLDTERQTLYLKRTDDIAVTVYLMAFRSKCSLICSRYSRKWAYRGLMMMRISKEDQQVN